MDKVAKRAKFEEAWSRIRVELVDHVASEGMPAEAIEWYGKNLDYNVPGGKLNRGMSVVDTAEILKGAPLDDDEYYKAAILGWGVELLQAFFLVSDDIMDSSITRRGQQCWYRTDGVGMIAINDSFMLEGAIYYLLKKHFRGQACYVDLLELFHDITYATEMGQLIDLITAPEDNVDLNKFSLEKHRLIVIYKTAYYSFYLPVALAMHLSGVPATYTIGEQTVEPYKAALSILLPLGEYFQIQDDFLDFSASPEELGKVGTDIVDNKCSWCINTALAVVTAKQRAVLDANYGRKDAAAEERVKQVFEAIGMKDRYAKYEAKVYGRLNQLIGEIPESDEPGTLKRAIFTSFLEKIYKRKK
ncbi:isoprenoid synthase domain-containing protein [Mycena pura]|uniref:(2E,6E)-farnesyl diphosphate synthase n=1 Tax=Mycena pura TaxID=153505 RepID=A0AAD6YTW1_9AGAR|nr:isoprenoid synthase domain-containing protein [Mycena pura]